MSGIMIPMDVPAKLKIKPARSFELREGTDCPQHRIKATMMLTAEIIREVNKNIKSLKMLFYVKIQNHLPPPIRRVNMKISYRTTGDFGN